MVLLMVSVRYVLQLWAAGGQLLETAECVSVMSFRLGLRSALRGFGDLETGRDFDIVLSHAVGSLLERGMSSGGDE